MSDLQHLRITHSGAVFGFSLSLLLWSICMSLGANTLVPELISDGLVIAGLLGIVVRLRRAFKRSGGEGGSATDGASC